MSIGELRLFINKYSAEIKISVIIAVISTVISIVSSALLQSSNARLITDITIGCIIILFLFAILFNIKRLLTNLIVNAPLLKLKIDDLYREDKYWERLRHFTKEKDLLAKVLVETTLPKVIETICRENSEIKTLNIILDSGTTITPIFKELIYRGIQFQKKDLTYIIYTNNLAGIEEVHRINPAICKIGERGFNLIGGKPLNAYRATTGELTQDFLNTLWKKQDIDKGKMITLSILTANWFTCGVDFKKIALCAKGEGHFKFKEDITIHCHYIIIISPLGKLLPLDDFTFLNKLVPKDPEQEYKAFTIPQDKRDKTYLLTSLRSEETLSPIVSTSIRLKNLKEENRETNYILCDECPVYNPEGDKIAVVVTEVPHQYIRDNFPKVFHCKL